MKKLLTFALLSCGVLCSAQDKPTAVPFNGIVTDALGKPIKGARIYVVSDNFFAKSDKKGRFGLTNVHPTDTLHVRYHKEHYDIQFFIHKYSFLLNLHCLHIQYCFSG